MFENLKKKVGAMSLKKKILTALVIVLGLVALKVGHFRLTRMSVSSLADDAYTVQMCAKRQGSVSASEYYAALRLYEAKRLHPETWRELRNHLKSTGGSSGITHYPQDVMLAWYRGGHEDSKRDAIAIEAERAEKVGPQLTPEERYVRDVYNALGE